MQVAGIFAGIGGLERGLSAAGHQASLFCEVWEPAKAVLRARFPDVPLESDVTELRDLPSGTQLLAGGFPCQDLSQAGNTAGIDGLRSGLVGHVFRLLDRRRIEWVVLENVPFMLHLNGGKALSIIIGALEERGYRWAYRVVSSLAFLPQRRERVLIVATTSEVDPASVLLADEAMPPSVHTQISTHAHGFYWTEGTRGLGWASDAVPTLKNGSSVGIPSSPAILLPNGAVITPDIRDAERLQGFPPDWTLPAQQIARGNLRWSLVGNAVTPAVAHWLGARLKSPAEYDTSRDMHLPLLSKWPKAARFDGERRYAVAINQFPVWLPRKPLHEFLEYPGKLLSSRATRGFLGRADKSTLRFAPGFKEALRSHLRRMEDASEEGLLVAACE
jgi:DNA (cytosine-5)-methyltransferase 1